MRVRAGRIIGVAIATEIGAVLLLVLLVWLLGPPDPEDARAFAGRIGVWVGPLAGFCLCLLGGWWVGKSVPSAGTLNGLLVGAAAAAIDVALLIAGGAAFQAVFVASNLGRIVAGTIGGSLGSRAVRPTA
jgi:apolipoprotein N-acyltransferase